MCDKSVIEDALAKYMDKIGDESAKEYTDAKAALEDTTLTQSQANDLVKKLLALLPPEEEITTPETDAATDDLTATDGVINDPEVTTAKDQETQGTDTKGCASVAALSVTALLPLAWFALKKRNKQ